MPLSVAGAFHTEHMEPAVGHLAGLARSVSAHDPRTRFISNRDGQVVHDGRDVLARIVGQIASPVRWDLCMETMADLGVTGILEMPPAGTLTGIAKRALKGVETFALKTPDQLDDARAFCDKHGEASGRIDTTPDLADGRLPRPRAPSTSPPRPPGADDARPPAPPIGEVASLRDRTDVTAAHGGQVVEWLVEDGDLVSPGQPLLRLHPEGGATDGRRSSASRSGAQHAAILGIGAYRPSPGGPQRRDRRARSTPATSGSSSAPASRSAAGPTAEETVQMMSVAASRTALERAGIDARQIDCVIVATVTHMLQTPAIATAIAHELGTDQAAAFDISAACAGFCHGVALASDMVRGGSAGYVLVIGVERLSDITDVGDRGTAFIFADGAGAAVVGPSDDPGHRPGRLGLRRRAVRPDPADARTGATWSPTRAGPA